MLEDVDPEPLPRMEKYVRLVADKLDVGTTVATTTDQRQEYNGSRCRNAFTTSPYTAGSPDATTVRATVSTVDPYVFSSVK